MQTNFIIVTNCTARKRAGVPLVRLKPPLASVGVASLAAGWRETLASEPPVISAGQLYVGRSISEAKATAKILNAGLFMVSAGLGLVPSERLVPGYDLSVVGEDTGLLGLLEARGASISDWWRELSQNRGLPWLLHAASTALVLIALPTTYLELLSADFAALPSALSSRLRVFTSNSGRKALANFPHIPVMPYDERLEALPSFAGTRSDFPQRALRHFVSSLGAHTLDAVSGSAAVEHALSSCHAPVIPLRRRLNDDEICEIIRKAWSACGGNSARLLRHVRDGELVACEQGRFAGLRRRVALEIAEENLPKIPEAQHVV